VTEWPNRDQAFVNVAQGIRAAVEELVISQSAYLLAKLENADSLGNCPNVIDLGERILKLLPDHEPTRSRTAAAYVKRWSRYLGGTSYIRSTVTGLIDVRTKRHEDLNQVTADLNQAIRLEPENAEYYYVRFSLAPNKHKSLSTADYERDMKLSPTDFEHAIELAPSTAKYYYSWACVRYFGEEERSGRGFARPPARFGTRIPRESCKRNGESCKKHGGDGTTIQAVKSLTSEAAVYTVVPPHDAFPPDGE
jgi:hypothetical protein